MVSRVVFFYFFFSPLYTILYNDIEIKKNEILIMFKYDKIVWELNGIESLGINTVCVVAFELIELFFVSSLLEPESDCRNSENTFQP